MTSERARRILITGVAGEIGAHLAAHFDAGGWHVRGVDRAEPARPVPAGLVFAACDLTDGAVAGRTLDAMTRDHGAPDVLINAAGLIANAPLVRLVDGEWQVHDFALWERVVSSSLTSTFHATALTVKHMLASRTKGVIVNVSSVCAQGSPGQAAYSAAKAGIEGLTRALGKELGPLGIRVVALALGYFDTASMHANVPDARLAKVMSAVPTRRLGTLDEVTHAAAFAIENGYVNGTVIEVDGGLVL